MRPVCLCLPFLAILFINNLQRSSPGPEAPSPPPYEEPEAYKVYSAVLPIDQWYWEGQGTMLILREIPPREWAISSPREILQGHGPVFAAEMEPVFKSFEEVNRTPKSLNSEIDLHRPHQFVGTAELNAAFAKGNQSGKRDDWQGFHQEFPKSSGYLILSGVGFNTDKTLALVYVEHRCGNGCGGAHYYVLQRREGVWVQYFPPM